MLNKKEIRERMEEGWIEASVMLQAIGKPEKDTQEFLEKNVNNIDKEDYCEIVNKDFFDGEKKKDFFTKVVELSIIFKDVKSILQFSLDFMPASIEVTHPNEIEVKSSEFNNFINDNLARLHDMNIMVKTLDKQSKRLFSTQNALLKNITFVSLRQGAKGIEQLARDAGVNAEFMEKVLKELIDKEIVVKDGKLYKINPDYKRQSKA
jgi:predicted transcriptional regulator